MPKLRRSSWVAMFACLGTLLPPNWAAAEDQAVLGATNANPLPLLTVEDVALEADQTLRGVVLNDNGKPAAGSPVSMHQLGHEIARTTTDENGRFAVTGLRGGIYQINAGRGVSLYRLWVTGTAPPVAKSSVTLVDGVAARGQQPFKELFTSHAFVISALIVGAIAIPIAVRNSRNDKRSGS